MEAFRRRRWERFDVAAAIEYAEFAELPRIWLLGWSLGTDLALRYDCDPAVVGAILLSPRSLRQRAGMGAERYVRAESRLHREDSRNRPNG